MRSVPQFVFTFGRQGLRLVRHRVVTVASFGLRDWQVFVEALATLLIVKVALHTMDFRRLMAWSRRVRGGTSIDLSRENVQRIAWLVQGASRLTCVRCLPRSLALTRVLARRGVATTMRIGVQTVDGELLAHAWVEWRGRALNDDERSLQEFAAFDNLRGDISSV